MRKRIDISEYNNIASLYKEGDSASTISKKYKVNTGAIRTALRGAGVATRERKIAQKLYYNTHKDELIERAAHIRRYMSTIESFCEKCGDKYIRVSNSQKWCKKCAPDKKANNRLAKYGISEPEYLQMIKDVNGVCPICLDHPAELIDHDHHTDKIRGVICCHCNTSLYLVENEEALKRAIEYLKRAKSS